MIGHSDTEGMGVSGRRRTYVVLVEATVDSELGDGAFVVLGYVEARDPRHAALIARRDAGDATKGREVVTVPASSWRVQQP